MTLSVTVGVLALQGAFLEHIKLLEKAAAVLKSSTRQDVTWHFLEVRNPEELARCNALIIPGGESTTMSLIAERSGLLEPLRDFVKMQRRPTWGTCAGLILLAESANRTKKGGQELIGGLDVRVSRNFFGRQTESFETDLNLAFLQEMDSFREGSDEVQPFSGIFIRAPIVDSILPIVGGQQIGEAQREDIVVAPSRGPAGKAAEKVSGKTVEIMATLPGRKARADLALGREVTNNEAGDIVAVKQGNVFGTSFHPELTQDARIHVWWLRQVLEAVTGKVYVTIA